MVDLIITEENIYCCKFNQIGYKLNINCYRIYHIIFILTVPSSFFFQMEKRHLSNFLLVQLVRALSPKYAVSMSICGRKTNTISCASYGRVYSSKCSFSSHFTVVSLSLPKNLSFLHALC